MVFIRKSADPTPLVDAVFSVVAMAKKDKLENGDENVVDATIGSLYGDDGKLVALHTVFDHYDAIDQRVKAAYAAGLKGNPSYREAVYEWVIAPSKADLCHSVIATPGGTGAISIAVSTFLGAGETLIIPEIAWGSYRLMANENGMKTATYRMFDGDHFNLESVKETVRKVMQEQERVVIIVNDPCHNPTGYSMTVQEWQELIAFINECSVTHPCIIINDIAYIDYSNDTAHVHDYMDTFNGISDNVLITVCSSCSKTLTSYGLRCGAATILARKEESVKEVECIMEKRARATWSNIPNAAMENFTWVVRENREAFEAEKQEYIDLMKQRSSRFLAEAKECGLEVYPYKEGFFVTLKIDDNSVRDKVHQALIEKHIYTVKVNHGIRVAVCSLPLRKTGGLAKVMKETEDSVMKE